MSLVVLFESTLFFLVCKLRAKGESRRLALNSTLNKQHTLFDLIIRF